MNIMIASDIHGSSYYCREMMNAFDREKPEKLLVLGDILYHGPRNALPKDYDPKEVAAMLNTLTGRVICVRGNCDCEVDQMMLNFPIMAESCLLFVNGRTIYATHGHHERPALSQGDILLNGHTHIPAWEKLDGGIIYVNPGSVSIPKNGTEHSYMMLNEAGFTWKSLDGKIYHELNFAEV